MPAGQSEAGGENFPRGNGSPDPEKASHNATGGLFFAGGPAQNSGYPTGGNLRSLRGQAGRALQNTLSKIGARGFGRCRGADPLKKRVRGYLMWTRASYSNARATILWLGFFNSPGLFSVSCLSPTPYISW